MPPFDGGGALAGKRVIVSPGHGYYFHTQYGWTTQRGQVNGLIEDIHTNEVAIDYLIPMLERAGARVFSARERSRQVEEAIVDDGPRSPGFSSQGTWQAGAYPGYEGGGYTYASGASSATATWDFRPRRSGSYPVWVWFREGANRNARARYVVGHSGGSTTVYLDQRSDGQRWVHLGDFPVTSPDRLSLALHHDTGAAGVTVADAVRFGAGMGSTERNGRASGQPRWKECSRYWLPYLGAPGAVYDLAGYTDRDDDVTARGRFAVWQGGDAFISIHTNGGGGTGTSSFIHDSHPYAGSSDLQRAIQERLVGAIRAFYEPGWTDRGRQSANFGELRATTTMPAVLLEVAFHDRARPDAALLAREDFRHDAARAVYRGVLHQLAPRGRAQPLAPSRPSLRDLGSGRVQVDWRTTADPLDPSASPDEFLVALSTDGHAFDNGERVGSGTRAVVSGLTPGRPSAFRVVAANPGGESEPSEPATITPR